MNLKKILDNIRFDSNQAIVFDIDDTLISSRNGQLIPTIFDFYNYCIDKGYKVYIITARAGTIKNMEITIQQLRSLGIANYKRLYFRKPFDMRVARSKKLARKHIPYNVVLSIGDQPGDIGEYGGIGILLS